MSNEQQPKQSFMDREISLRGKVVIYVVLVLFTVAPILSATIASIVASCCRSRLDESGVHPCVIHGVDVGGPLYKMFVGGWFALLTVPVGLLFIVGITYQILSERKRRVA